jgi:prepilin-type N-terminal cleavage/methylation domain-containing protein
MQRKDGSPIKEEQMVQRKGKAKGFTLIELVIVIIIIGILALVSVPLYRGYVRRAMAAEGKALAGSIAHAQKLYYAEHSNYLAVANTGYDATLDVDARSNQYFRTYTVTVAAGPSFTATTSGVGDAANITITCTGNPTSPVILTATDGGAAMP